MFVASIPQHLNTSTNKQQTIMKKSIFTLFSLAFLGLSNTYAQVGIGTQNPHASAAFEIESTTQGLLPPRMTTSERDAIANPANGLTIFNTEQNCLNIWVGYWRNLCAFDNTANTASISHDSFDYEDVFNPATGLTWLDRNLGATQVATASDDADSYGHLFQWGRAADGHQLRSLNCSTSDCFNAQNNNTNLPPTAADVTDPTWNGKFIYNTASPRDWHQDNPDDDLWQGVNGVNNPCPSGYRLPTEAEWDAERLSWSPNNNSAGAFASPLKLPAAGYRNRTNGSLVNVGSFGDYWSSTVSGSYARYLVFNSSNAGMDTGNRAFGFSVRCLKD